MIIKIDSVCTKVIKMPRRKAWMKIPRCLMELHILDTNEGKQLSLFATDF